MSQNRDAGSVPGTLPAAYIDQMKSLLGEADFFQYEAALRRSPERGLRINPLKMEDAHALRMMNLAADPVPWARHGYYYHDERPGQSPLHEAGLYYIQEPSAMSAVTLLDPQPGETILDLCAAPGGKSTQIAGCMGGQGILVCNEPVPSRAKILSSNLERMGVRNGFVLCEQPERLSERLNGCFDRILVDAPCSGEGMFRKLPESREQWNSGSPEQCAARQRQILDSVAVMLKPGGILVYSTCTFNSTENEETVAWFLEAHPEFETEAFHLEGLPEAPSGMQHLYPHQVRGEGHFICRMIRTGSGTDRKMVQSLGSGKGKKQKEMIPDLSGFLAFHPDPEHLYLDGKRLWLVPDRSMMDRLQGLHILRSGLALCDCRGRMPEPDHAAGMALWGQEVLHTLSLSWEEMCLYQAGETLHREGAKGWTQMRYQGIPLGWAKQSDGMYKNHYPKGIRRRSGQGISSVQEEES